ncbi:hypothetical protein BC827DRAFT_1272784 [Russula dissimulans]|nr:hypothetical protein BC827DRAFT_1272784 [Russula dissimulans]
MERPAPNLPQTPTDTPASRPSNHSLMVGLGKLDITADNRPKPEIISKGNLVVTGGANVTPQALLLAAPHINETIAKNLKLPATSPPPTIRANTKWAKITINGAPTGKTATRGPFTPDECHAALAAVNPYYATLLITQKPSWVPPPTSYKEGAISSLSIAFEDLDGARLRTLFVDRYIFFHGNRTSIKKWKQRNNKLNAGPQPREAEQHTSNAHPEEEEIKRVLNILATPATPAREMAPEKTPCAKIQWTTHDISPDSPFSFSMAATSNSPNPPTRSLLFQPSPPPPVAASAAQVPSGPPSLLPMCTAGRQPPFHQLRPPTLPAPPRRVT